MGLIVQNDTYRTNGKVENWNDLATKVVEEVAQAKNVDPLDLDPLYKVVDSDALNDLVTRSARWVRIDFEYEGRTITVQGDGHVDVE